MPMSLRNIVVSVVAGVLLVLGLYLGGLFVAHGFDPNFLAIDSCLDRGGRWDHASQGCEGVP